MKKHLLRAMCLTLSFLSWGGVNLASAQENSATFSLENGTLTVVGKGDLSQATVTTEDIVFQAEAVNKIFKADGENKVSVKKGEAYDSEATYYGSTVTLGETALNSGAPTSGNYYTVTSSVKDLATSLGYKVYNCYFIQSYVDDKNIYNKVGFNNYNESAAISDITGLASQNGWNHTQTGTDGWYYYCLVKGTMTVGQYELTNGKYTGEDGLEIIILTTSNRDQYLPTTVTVTSKSDDLFVKSGDKTFDILNGSTYTYQNGDLFYTGSVTASDEALNNSTYFAESGDGASLIGYYTDTFLAILKTQLDKNPKTVIIKTEENETSKATITNAIVRALVNCSSIETLNLQDTYLESLNTYAPSKYNAGYGDPTFFVGEPTGDYNPAKNSTLKTLYMPATGTKMISEVTDNNNTYRLFQYLQGLKELHLSEGIETLGENAISNVGQDGLPKLTSITFPNTLKTAKAYCLNGQSDILTLSFPKGMESIERHAMWGTNAKDVYFLSLDAPKVAAHAWGESNYISNNAMTNEVKVGDTEETSITVNKQTGFAVRQNYETQNGWYAMLHYPAACSKEQAAKYTDITRGYKKIVYGVEDETFKKEASGTAGNTQGVMYYYYEPGQETTTLTGKGEDQDANILGSVEASKRFINIYPTSTNPPYGGNYDGGYEDYYVGSQYIWPSMGQSQRACIVAENGVLWDGVTSIGEGIRNAAKLDGKETTYPAESDGSEYIGLHQFVFTQADVTTDKTEEWDVTKYADGKWHSICLPFHVTKAKMKETFGANADGEYNFRVCKFHKVDRTDDKLKLYFNDEYFEKAEDDEVVLTAHVSYMIKAKKENMVDGEKVVLKNYVLEAGSPVPTNVTVNAKSSGSEGETEANQYYFIGQYNSGVTIPQYSYFFSKSKSYFRFQAGTTAKWNGYTSVVEAPNGVADYNQYFKTGSDAKLSTIWNDEDDTTGIENVTIIAGDEIIYTSDNVYNLSGQLVSTRGLNGLAKGIYVQNGKKYIVK